MRRAGEGTVAGSGRVRPGLRAMAVLVIVTACGTLDPTPPPPAAANVLVILVDDVRSNAFGVTGHPFAKTPRIDQLAAEGARFTNAFVVSSLCTPSRATIMTGRYGHTTGVVNNSKSLSSEVPTVAARLQNVGFRTALIGKWHLGGGGSPQPGWDRWVSFPDQGVYLDPTFNIDGQEVTVSGHMTDLVTRFALEFLDDLREDTPFLLVVSHKAAHAVPVPQERYRDLYASTPVAMPPTLNEDLSTKPPVVALRQDTKDTLVLANRVRRYHETLAGVDESTGILLDKLESMGRLDRTLVIMVSDNGLFHGEHGLSDKRLAYEESMRIPLIVRYPPWFVPGSVIDHLALNLDIAPTVLNVAGLAPPDLPGYSLREVAGRPVRTAFLYEYSYEQGFPATPSLRAVRTRQYKYVTYFDAFGSEELYDLSQDPLETRNLIGDPVYANVYEALRDRLARLRAEAGDTNDAFEPLEATIGALSH